MKNFVRRCLFFFLLMVPVCSVMEPAYGHDTVWPGEKLQAMYPAAQSFEQRNLYVSDTQKARIEAVLGATLPEEDLKPSIYLAVVRKDVDDRPRREAILLFIDAQGQGGVVETGIVVNTRGELAAVRIFENREPEAIRGKSFLDQFAGKTAAAPFAVGQDIAAPPGLEKTAQAIASGARRGLLIVDELFRRK